MKCTVEGCDNEVARCDLCRRHYDERGRKRAPAGQSVQLDGLRVRAEVAEAMVEAASVEDIPVPEWRRRAYADRLRNGQRPERIQGAGSSPRGTDGSRRRRRLT